MIGWLVEYSAHLARCHLFSGVVFEHMCSSFSQHWSCRPCQTLELPRAVIVSISKLRSIRAFKGDFWERHIWLNLTLGLVSLAAVALEEERITWTSLGRATSWLPCSAVS